MMKRNYRVYWYECNLTNKKSRKFFTELGAIIYIWYLERVWNTYAKLEIL